MRINQNKALFSSSFALVPYSIHHVSTYHRWMGDPHILRLTASDRLSLAEEIENCLDWAKDPDKLTFIVLCRGLAPDMSDAEWLALVSGSPQRHTDVLAGDVNLFVNGVFEPGQAEIEVMIAEPRARRQGLATAALAQLMLFAQTHLDIVEFVAKIGADNVPSRRLFQGMGFRPSDYMPGQDNDDALLGEPNVFDEVELLFTPPPPSETLHIVSAQSNNSSLPEMDALAEMPSS